MSEHDRPSENPLEDVLRGEAQRLEGLTDAMLGEFAKGLGSMQVTAVAVRRVLLAYVDGRASATAVQKWASFVRRGYVAETGDPVRPLNIEYSSDSESKIADAVSCLDEIGDLIDGRFSREDALRMIGELEGQ